MATAKKKTTQKKKPARKKKVTSRKSTTANRKKSAESKRNALIAALKVDLAATKKALAAAQKGASKDVQLIRSAAKAEAAVLRDQLKAAMKREKALRTMAEKKAKMLWAEGQRWEREQLARIKKIVAGRRG